MIQILPGNRLLIEIFGKLSFWSGLDRYRECILTLNIWAYIFAFCEFRLKYCHLNLWRQYLTNFKWIFCTQNPSTAIVPLPVFIFHRLNHLNNLGKAKDFLKWRIRIDHHITKTKKIDIHLTYMFIYIFFFFFVFGGGVSFGVFW